MTQKGNHIDSFVRHSSVNESFTDDDIKAVHHDGGRELMAHFNYTMSDVWAEPATWADYATFEPEALPTSPEPESHGALPSPSPFIYEGYYNGYARVKSTPGSRPSPAPSPSA